MENHTFPHIPPQESLDWAYTMRREMQEILPNLFLGPYASAMKSKLNVLIQHGITHIVCIRQAVEANFIRANFPGQFRYLVLDIADSVTENIIQYFPQVKHFLEECFCSGGKALVHGNAGISRRDHHIVWVLTNDQSLYPSRKYWIKPFSNAALVIAYIMEKYGLCYKDAFFYVQQRRFCINPNDGFAQQLSEYEPIYRARLSFLNGSRSTDNCFLKRKCVDDEEDEEMRFPT